MLRLNMNRFDNVIEAINKPSNSYNSYTGGGGNGYSCGFDNMSDSSSQNTNCIGNKSTRHHRSSGGDINKNRMKKQIIKHSMKRVNWFMEILPTNRQLSKIIQKRYTTLE